MDEFVERPGYLARVPGVRGPFGQGRFDNGNWWVKFRVDLDHRLAWHAVQELGHVINYLSPDERLPTVLMPVSPPSYLNGGPRDFLGWVIESGEPGFSPKSCAEWLEARLPKPVEDEAQWSRG